MRPRPERQPRVHLDPHAPGRRRIVAPLRRHEKPLADFHRLQMLARKRHPVPQIGRFHLAAKPLPQPPGQRVIVEKRS